MTADPAGNQVPAHERLLDLVIALTHARPMMTKQQIRAHIPGYQVGTTTDAFERMFERDKTTLKELGIPLLTLVGTVHDDEVGYRIDMDDYELPAIELTSAELGMVALAAQAWHDSAMARSAQRALTKLRAVSANAGAIDPGPRLHLQAPDAVLPTLLEAITAGVVIRFRYHAARTGATTDRTVEPWRIYARDRGWYLVGWDRDRDAERVFRLSRVRGRVRRLSDRAQVPVPADTSVAEPAMVTARLAIRSDRAASLRAQGHVRGHVTAAGAERDVVDVQVPDLSAFAAELAGYADAVVVLDPPRLRAQVLDHLQSAAGLADAAQVVHGHGAESAQEET